MEMASSFSLNFGLTSFHVVVVAVSTFLLGTFSLSHLLIHYLPSLQQAVIQQSKKACCSRIQSWRKFSAFLLPLALTETTEKRFEVVVSESEGVLDSMHCLSEWSIPVWFAKALCFVRIHTWNKKECLFEKANILEIKYESSSLA